VERAEELAQFHYSIQEEPQQRWQIVRREWFCATNPDIAVVHLYICQDNEARVKTTA